MKYKTIHLLNDYLKPFTDELSIRELLTYIYTYQDDIILQRNGETKNGLGKIIVQKTDTSQPWGRFPTYKTISATLLEDTENELWKQGFNYPCVTTYASYKGNKRTSDNMLALFALTFDLDQVGVDSIQLLYNDIHEGLIPEPNIITPTGSGVHLTYKLTAPIYFDTTNRNERVNIVNRMLYSFYEQLQKYTHQDQKLNRLGINQGMRVVSSRAKQEYGNDIVRAFRTDAPTISLEHFNTFLQYTLKEDKGRVPEEKLRRVFDNYTLPDAYFSKQEREAIKHNFEKNSLLETVLNLQQDGDKKMEVSPLEAQLYIQALKELDCSFEGHRYFTMYDLIRMLLNTPSLTDAQRKDYIYKGYAELVKKQEKFNDKTTFTYDELTSLVNEMFRKREKYLYSCKTKALHYANHYVKVHTPFLSDKITEIRTDLNNKKREIERNQFAIAWEHGRKEFVDTFLDSVDLPLTKSSFTKLRQAFMKELTLYRYEKDPILKRITREELKIRGSQYIQEKNKRMPIMFKTDRQKCMIVFNFCLAIGGIPSRPLVRSKYPLMEHTDDYVIDKAIALYKEFQGVQQEAYERGKAQLLQDLKRKDFSRITYKTYEKWSHEHNPYYQDINHMYDIAYKSKQGEDDSWNEEDDQDNKPKGGITYDRYQEGFHERDHKELLDRFLTRYGASLLLKEQFSHLPPEAIQTACADLPKFSSKQLDDFMFLDGYENTRQLYFLLNIAGVSPNMMQAHIFTEREAQDNQTLVNRFNKTVYDLYRSFFGGLAFNVHLQLQNARQHTTKITTKTFERFKQLSLV